MFCLVGYHLGTKVPGVMDELPGTPKLRILDTEWCLGEGVFHCHVDQFYSDEAGQLNTALRVRCAKLRT